MDKTKKVHNKVRGKSKVKCNITCHLCGLPVCATCSGIGCQDCNYVAHKMECPRKEYID